MARSMARVTFSPTTTPIDPPMKPYSMAPMTVRRPPTRPTAETSASQESVLAFPARSRSAYGRLSRKPRGSALTRPRSNSSQAPSKSMSSRSRAEMRKWKAHFGQTERFLRTSLR